MMDYREKVGALVEKSVDYSGKFVNHLRDYKESPLESVKDDFNSILENVKNNHGKRMAYAMAMSGFTTPLKAYLETSGKSINSFVYDSSPELIQKAFDSIYYSVPESMNWLLNFSTSGEEMSDLASIVARTFSLGVGYAIGHFVYEKVREKPMKQLGLRKDGSFKRGVGKGAYDFGLAMTLGGVWEFVKYYSVNKVVGETDSSKTTNSATAVLLPTSVLQIARGWMLDVSHELVDFRESERTPKWLRNKSKKFKKNLFNGMCVASVLASGLVYYFNDASFLPEKNIDNSSQIEIGQEESDLLERGIRDYENLEKVLEDDEL